MQGYFEMIEQTSAEFRRNRQQWIDCKDTRGRTPLIVAAVKGHYLVVELFIQLGASLDMMDNLGCTALHGAVYHRHDAVATMLINQGASPFVENMQGMTPMDIVCKYGQNVGLLRHIETRAIYCGWVEQKVPKYVLGHGWSRRWIVLAQRLTYHRHGSLHDQPDVRTVLLSYHCIKSMMATCKCRLDRSYASREPCSHRSALRNRKMLHAVGVHLGSGHPSVRGAATSTRQGRIVVHFRPIEVDEISLQMLSDMVSYINWASNLNTIDSPEVVGHRPTMAYASAISDAPGGSRPHWAFEPPRLLQTSQEDDTRRYSNSTQEMMPELEAAVSSSTVVRNDGSMFTEPSQDQDAENTGSSQRTEKECLICMDNKIEIVFCHQNEMYAALHVLIK